MWDFVVGRCIEGDTLVTLDVWNHDGGREKADFGSSGDTLQLVRRQYGHGLYGAWPEKDNVPPLVPVRPDPPVKQIKSNRRDISVNLFVLHATRKPSSLFTKESPEVSTISYSTASNRISHFERFYEKWNSSIFQCQRVYVWWIFIWKSRLLIN